MEKYIKCTDKFHNEVKENSFVDVQKDGVHQVYKKDDGQLYFKPYGEEDKVSAYFSNDMVLCDENGNWLGVT
jgi:hypothetical protein